MPYSIFDKAADSPPEIRTAGLRIWHDDMRKFVAGAGRYQFRFPVVPQRQLGHDTPTAWPTGGDLRSVTVSDHEQLLLIVGHANFPPGYGQRRWANLELVETPTPAMQPTQTPPTRPRNPIGLVCVTFAGRRLNVTVWHGPVERHRQFDEDGFDMGPGRISCVRGSFEFSTKIPRIMGSDFAALTGLKPGHAVTIDAPFVIRDGILRRLITTNAVVLATNSGIEEGEFKCRVEYQTSGAYSIEDCDA